MSAVAQTRAEWLAERQTYLGATDIAAIVGMNKYKTPLEVFLDKTGQAEEDTEFKVAAEIGLALEPLLTDIYNRVHGAELITVPMIRHPKYPFIACNPDRMYDDMTKGVELKTYGNFTEGEWGEEGTDEVPSAYWVQAQICMNLMGVESWDVFGLNRNTCEWRTHTVNRDHGIWETLLARGVAFWNDHVLTGIPPAVTGKDGDTEWLRSKFKDSTPGESVMSTKDIDILAAELLEVSVERKSACERFDRLRNQMMQFMGTAETCHTMSGIFKWAGTPRKFNVPKVKS